MIRVKSFPVLLITALLASPLHADQNAPELDELFALLKGDIESTTAAAVSGEIWTAWLRHDDAEVRVLMEAGIRDMRANRLHDALRRFDAAIERAPDFAEAWNKRATVYYMMGDFDSSAADVVETLRLEPRHFGALAGQGMMSMQEKNIDQALLYFRRALDANPHLEQMRRYIELLSQMRDEKAI